MPYNLYKNVTVSFSPILSIFLFFLRWNLWSQDPFSHKYFDYLDHSFSHIFLWRSLLFINSPQIPVKGAEVTSQHRSFLPGSRGWRFLSREAAKPPRKLKLEASPHHYHLSRLPLFPPSSLLSILSSDSTVCCFFFLP